MHIGTCIKNASKRVVIILHQIAPVIQTEAAQAEEAALQTLKAAPEARTRSNTLTTTAPVVVGSSETGNYKSEASTNLNNSKWILS